MGFEPLRIIAEGRMTVHDGRLHVGNVPLSDLVDNLPCTYVTAGHFDYGEVRIVVELVNSVAPEVAA